MVGCRRKTRKPERKALEGRRNRHRQPQPQREMCSQQIQLVHNLNNKPHVTPLSLSSNTYYI
jgi:hypothetical protein